MSSDVREVLLDDMEYRHPKLGGYMRCQKQDQDKLAHLRQRANKMKTTRWGYNVSD